MGWLESNAAGVAVGRHAGREWCDVRGEGLAANSPGDATRHRPTDRIGPTEGTDTIQVTGTHLP